MVHMDWQNHLNPHSRLRIDSHTEYGVRLGPTVFAYDHREAAQTDADSSDDAFLVIRDVGAWRVA